MFLGDSPYFSWLKKETLWPLRYLGTFLPQIIKLYHIASSKWKINFITRGATDFPKEIFCSRTIIQYFRMSEAFGLTLLPIGGGGGGEIFIPHHQNISCHSETT